MKKFVHLFILFITLQNFVKGQLVFSEDFDNYNVGLISTQSSDWVQTSPSTPSVEVKIDGGALLNCSGSDTDEKYLAFDGETCHRINTNTGTELDLSFKGMFGAFEFILLEDDVAFYSFNYDDYYEFNANFQIDFNAHVIKRYDAWQLVETTTIPSTITHLSQIRFEGFLNLGCISLYDYTDVDNDDYYASEDCDDFNPNVNPGMVEIIYNGLDDDCNPATLDDDLDGDGYPYATDCNDQNFNINPGVTEVPYNLIDDDCNPLTPDDDLDGDGYPMATDCNDQNANVNPNASEVPYNAIDDDCNPTTKDDDLDGDGYVMADDCDDKNENVNPGQIEKPYNALDDDCNPNTKDDDLDGDGFVKKDDCNDDNADINPSASEIAYNDIDDDCNLNTSDDDFDQDNFDIGEDCNDNDPLINPLAIEIPNNDIDENCDGIITAEKNIELEKIKISPNPAINNLTIHSKDNSIIYVIYDIHGKIVKKGSEKIIEISHLISGVYSIIIMENNKIITQTKFIKI